MTQGNDNDIAIVGMAIRVAGALTPEQYWRNLCDGVESLSVYTDAELAERGVSPAELADPAYVKAGMPLPGMEEFDPEFFGFSPKEAAILDPQHRQFYEVAWEALERAGHPPARFDGNIAVFAGSGMASYFARNLMSNPELVESVGVFLLRHTGNDKDFLATRVSYAFDLKGPAINVQTACSTSLVATHLAVQSLLAGECDMALAGGCTIDLPHRVGYHYKEGEILSPDGHCRPFDHRSKGTVFGSGCGVVVLRRLADALEAGDHIHAVIKGTAVNNDGAGKVGYLAPSVDGQAAAVAEALAVAGVDADSVGYIECHGTGTPVGDPIEVAALTNAFRESTDRVDYCRIGSVKSNIGHTDTAAGVVGLIKAALALEHGRIPPSLGFEAPNPVIPFDGSPFRVAAKLEEWRPGNVPRRAGVNSLGVGGTNAFAVLEEPPRRAAPPADDNPQLLVLSARSRRALDEAGTRLAEWLRNAPRQPLADIAYTLLEGRHAFEHRRVLAAASHEEAIALLESPDARRVFTHADEVDRPSVVFMYPGGGAQYFRMGRGLYDREAVFREHMDRGLALLKSRFGTDLREIFLAGPEDRDRVSSELTRPSVQLPLIFLVEIALTRLWEHYGVKPAAVIGHSLGENTAACVAGVLSFEDALGLVLLRGQLMDEVPQGAMLSVSLPAEELRAELGDQLDLAAANSPQLSVASGPEELIAELAERLAAKGIDSQRVRINIAAHSRLLEGILERFGAYLRSVRLHPPTLPIISNRTGQWLDPERARSPEYWVEHLRNSVFFADGVSTLLESRDRVFLEVGPGHTLGAFVRQNPEAPAQRVFASLRHPDDPVEDNTYFRTIIGRLWAVGVNPAIERLWEAPRQRVALPTYPFQHAPYWIEPGKGHSASLLEDTRPLRQENFDDWFRVPRWVQQGILETSDELHTWLVFLGDEPIGQALVERLRAAGNTVVTVQAGDTYARLDEQAFTIAAEAGGAGYLELVETLAEAGCCRIASCTPGC
jgi:acyl transferase domain-containing protein